MNKKISLGITIGLMALAAAVTFIITYNYSLNVFNSKVKSVSEKESIYIRLSEMDKYVRANYINDIDEDMLLALNNFGSERGLIAHSTRANTLTTPDDALASVNNLMTYIDTFDQFLATYKNSIR